MARGFTWCRYFDDDGGEWAVVVDSDYVSHLERGWEAIPTNALYPLPRTWRTRRVEGLDANGSRQFAVVASLTADLWTGAALVFQIRDSEGIPQFCNVIRRHGEVRPAVRADPA